MNYFNKNLNYLLKERNLNKNKLSILLNQPRSAMTQLFKASNPQADTLINISKVFNVPIDKLLLVDMENETRN